MITNLTEELKVNNTLDEIFSHSKYLIIPREKINYLDALERLSLDWESPASLDWALEESDFLTSSLRKGRGRSGVTRTSSLGEFHPSSSAESLGLLVGGSSSHTESLLPLDTRSGTELSGALF